MNQWLLNLNQCAVVTSNATDNYQNFAHYNFKRLIYTACAADFGSGKIVIIYFNGHDRVKYRTLLLKALLLHFKEKVPRIEAGLPFRHPKNYGLCSLYRFGKAGLSWFLIPRINAINLPKRLYRQDFRKSSVLPVAPAPVKSPSPINDSTGPTSPATSKSPWCSSRSSPASA